MLHAPLYNLHHRRGDQSRLCDQSFAVSHVRDGSRHLINEKGVSAEVKTFAGDMMKDHHKSTEGLRGAAATDRVTLPTDMGDELRKKLESLKPLSGPTLDAAYVSTQVSAHTDAVELFEKFSNDGEGGALKSFAQETYPTIRMHLIRARNFNVEQ
jgi:putative membrane protein